MKKYVTLFCLIFTFSHFTNLAIAQLNPPDTIGTGNPVLNVLYAEDFSTPGLPPGWNTLDTGTNPIQVLWAWCESSGAGTAGACPKVWSGKGNYQTPFAATTASTGFLVAESFTVNAPHKSILKMPVQDFSNQDEVWIHFQSHIGGFKFDPAQYAILNVSTDEVNWTPFYCFPSLILDEGFRWSINPEYIYLDISEVAANQETVFIQWYWEGDDEYYWAIDDLKIYDGDPRPNNDLELSLEWYAFASNKIIPTSQVSPFGFMADISNKGLSTQNNIQQTIDVFKDNELVHTDTLFFESLAPGETIEDQIFPNLFTPSGSAGNYEGRYFVQSDSVDFTPRDNLITFTFATSDTTFANEDCISYSVAPRPDSWPTNNPHSWSWGNYFYMPNGEGCVATSASFGVHNGSMLGGKELFIHLYEWEDANNNALVEKEERTLVGEHTYILNSSTPQGFITVNLKEPGGQGEVQLQDNTAYLLMLEYETNDSQDLIISCNRRNNYEPMIVVAGSLNQPRYGGMIAVEPSIVNATYEPVGFGENYIPAVRLNIDLKTPTSNLLPADHVIKTYPSPVDEQLSIELQLNENFAELEVQVVDAKGRLIQQQAYQNVQNETILIPTVDLTNGIYFLKILTEAGVRSEQFVVQH